ncbi:ABC transporter ATP-binding protein [Synechococcus sp. CBW1004]|jgi:putative ABC transport system ATP-binding protein|uniref:ABC transporter ATP-binding protein n=1 Tax=Synechococcus sp. CBW1004 TaxID=1353136 RepID=UPI0018CE0CC9|nr:ATP-binding cassette domain-containing protein [Synechococcus sp. CBW1004]QPN62074.1 ATP-binding cassette domain-containing protein [Synechococcus sp. CBW1004]
MQESDGYAIIANDLSHVYQAGDLATSVLKNVCFSVAAGEFVSLVGPSGCGKTTLLTLIGGLKPTQSGSLRVLGRELRGCSNQELLRLRSEIGIVFQAHHLMPFLTALQNVQVAMEVTLRHTHKERSRRATELLADLGLESKIHSYPSMLSGGQKQRVAFARAMACEPKLILADEPTASLDRATGRDVVLTMQSRAREHGIAVLMATHDPRVIDMADRVIKIDDGQIVS